MRLVISVVPEWAQASDHTGAGELGFSEVNIKSDVLERQTHPRDIWLTYCVWLCTSRLNIQARRRWKTSIGSLAPLGVA